MRRRWVLAAGIAGGLVALLGAPGAGRAEIIADSIAEFSGVQGQNGWISGYRNYTTALTDDYDPVGEFVPFEGGEGFGDWDGFWQLWTGTAWDMETLAIGPWTYMAAEDAHPNGENSYPYEEHWAMRRWVADELSTTTALAVTWNLRKQNTGGGTGVSGGVWINGARLDSAAVAWNDGVGVTRTAYVNAAPGTFVDCVLSPAGPSGDREDGSDGSFFSMQIDTTLPDFPVQPDGRVFVPVGSPDTDADGLPDFWEQHYMPGPLTQLTATGDPDADGFTNTQEFQRSTDPTQADSDGDGLRDGVETDTGFYSSPTNTGTSPRLPDTDADGRTDGEEVLGDPTSDPTQWDTDADTFSDGEEVASGHDPNDVNHNPFTTPIADSTIDFSNAQGPNWYWGYIDRTGGRSQEAYDPAADFIAFPPEVWTGAQWDLVDNNTTAGAWTELAAETTHPSGPSPVHWTVRRWVPSDLTGVTPMALRWHVRKTNTGCGNGVTGALFINGVVRDRVAIAGNDGTGVTHTYFANLQNGDRVDLILNPRGADGNDQDGCDGSATSLLVDPTIPKMPIQPDGTLFIPANAGDTDADGLPDVWELLYAPDLTVLTGAGDNDGDGLNNSGEVARGSSPLVADTDGDGLSDNVETKTGVFAGPTDTGTDPTKADTDGDTRSDGDEVNGTPSTDPNKVDTDGDTFNDADEVATGHDPNDPNNSRATTRLCNTQVEFSGVQGQAGLYFGYRNLTQDGQGPADYDPDTAFVPFTGGDGFGAWDGVNQQWTGGAWDLETAGAAPWTYLASDEGHPNGIANGELHWAVRRWAADEVTETIPVALRWHIHKANAGCGNGVTGAVFVDGVFTDSAAIAFDAGSGITRTYYVYLSPGSLVDLVLSPTGTYDVTDPGAGGWENDWCDGSVFWLEVDTQLPPNPTQPDGTPFLPAGEPEIVAFTGNAATRQFTVTWKSEAGKTYAVKVSSDLVTWIDVATGIPSGGAQTVFNETVAAPLPGARFYRVFQE